MQIAEWRAIYPSGPLHALESAAQDAVLRTRSPDEYGSSIGKDPRQLITIVAIDERSLGGVDRGHEESLVAEPLHAPRRDEHAIHVANRTVERQLTDAEAAAQASGRL